MPFLGEYIYTLDAANRISVPPRYRERIGPEAVLLKAPEKCIYLYTNETFEELIGPVRGHSKTFEGRKGLRQIYEDALPISIDKNGRIVLPAECVEYANLKDEVFMLGAFNRFEIWNKANYDAFMADPSIEAEDLMLNY